MATSGSSAMSILLTEIDCPNLKSLNEFSFKTTNEFLIWSKENPSISSRTDFQCIQTCIIAQTAKLDERKRNSNEKLYSVGHSNLNMLKTSRHLILTFEDFDQRIWNQFWNVFLCRLFAENFPVRIQYFNTNPSLFDLNFFIENYLSFDNRNEKILCENFFFQRCFHLELFEDFLKRFSNDSFEILLIDDLFSLIRPFVGLDQRMKNFLLHLTYQLNRLAQQHSLLIITGLVLSKSDVSIEDFLADEFVFFRKISSTNNEISVRSNSNNFILNFDQWTERFSSR